MGESKFFSTKLVPFMLYQKLEIHVDHFSVFVYREHGVVGDMRDTWPNARVRKNVSLIRTYHGFKGISEAFTLFFSSFSRTSTL